MSELEQVARVWRAETTFPEIEDAIDHGHGSWVIAPATARALARLVVAQRPERILEFGAGLSSVILARSVARSGGGWLTSIEQMPEWCANAWAEVHNTLTVDASLVASTLRTTVGTGGLYYRYAAAAPELLHTRGPFDLVYIDGPQEWYGRDGTLHLCCAFLSAHALIVVDGAANPDAVAMIERWLAMYLGLTLEIFDSACGRGVAVLRYSGGTTRRLPAVAVAATAFRYFRTLPRRWRFALALGATRRFGRDAGATKAGHESAPVG